MGAMQQPEEHQPKMSNGEKESPALEAEVPFVTESDPAQQMMPPPEVRNGQPNSLPPQQVYINAPPPEAVLPNGITGLESQLMGLRMDPGGEAAAENGEGADENNDAGAEPEVEPVKLFVGQVRNTNFSMVRKHE